MLQQQLILSRYFAKLVALEMSDPTSGFGGRYTTARQSSLIIQAQQNMLDCFKHLARDGAGMLFFAHTQTQSDEMERRALEAHRNWYQASTGRYYSDAYPAAPTPMLLTQQHHSNKKPRYGEWAKEQQAKQRQQLMRSVV